MSKVYAIPDELVFSPCKVDGHYWKQFHSLISYLGQPEALTELKTQDEKAYFELIDCLVTFVRETENELFAKGHLIEVDLQDQAKQS